MPAKHKIYALDLVSIEEKNVGVKLVASETKQHKNISQAGILGNGRQQKTEKGGKVFRFQETIAKGLKKRVEGGFNLVLAEKIF